VLVLIGLVLDVASLGKRVRSGVDLVGAKGGVEGIVNLLASVLELEVVVLIWVKLVVAVTFLLAFALEKRAAAAQVEDVVGAEEGLLKVLVGPARGCRSRRGDGGRGAGARGGCRRGGWCGGGEPVAGRGG
jgi:uncharacterized membrane protein YgcG